MPEWEYLVVDRDVAEDARQAAGVLDDLGAAGWELVGAVTSERPARVVIRYLLKRPRAGPTAGTPSTS